MKFLKHLSLCLLAGSLVFTSCNKNDDDKDGNPKSTTEVKKSLIGMWKATSEIYKEYDAAGNVIEEGTETYGENELIIAFAEGGGYIVTWEGETPEGGSYEVKDQTTKYGVTGYYLSLKEGTSTEETDYSLLTVSGSSLTLTTFDEDYDDNDKLYLAEMYTTTFKKK